MCVLCQENKGRDWGVCVCVLLCVKKIKDLGQTWWSHMPVVPALWQAEMGGSLEPRRLRLQ